MDELDETNSLHSTNENLHEEICQLIISIVGDYKLPYPEVIYLIEKVIKHKLIQTLELALNISNYRGSDQIEFEDILFLLRNDLTTLKRLYNFISFDKSIKNIESSLLNEENDSDKIAASPRTSRKNNKEKFISFFKALDLKNGSVLDRVTNNQNTIVDQLQIKNSLRSEKQEKNLTCEQYVELINLRHAAFKNLSKKKYQKLINCLFLNSNEITNKMKPIPESCHEIIGFLFREYLHHLIETSLEINKHNSITSNDIYEYCRLNISNKSNGSGIINLKMNASSNKSTINNNYVNIKHIKKYSFF